VHFGRRPIRPQFPLTRHNLPSLRDLRVTFCPESDQPLSFGYGSAPKLTRLDVAGLPQGGTPPRSEWPAGAVFLLEMYSFMGLGETLLDARVSCSWASSTFDDGCCTPTDDSYWDEETATWSFDEAKPRGADKTIDLLYSSLRPGALPSDEYIPMKRLLSGLKQLSRLTSLTVDADYAWAPAPVILHEPAATAGLEAHDAHDRRVAELALTRRREWATDARRLFSGMASTLRRLELQVPSLGVNRRPVHLPPSLSLLTALENLEVAPYRLHSVGAGLRTLTSLRRLEIEGDVPFGGRGRHAPYFARDLLPLTALEHLRLLEPPACLAPVIADALPALAKLVLREYGVWAGSKASKLPPADVLNAAMARVARGGVRVYLARGKDDYAPRGPVGVAELGELVRLVERKREPEEARRAHDEAHARGIAKADRTEAADARPSGA
jgi:hypothetical protein